MQRNMTGFAFTVALPMTDEAVEMVMERMEAVSNG